MTVTCSNVQLLNKLLLEKSLTNSLKSCYIDTKMGNKKWQPFFKNFYFFLDSYPTYLQAYFSMLKNYIKQCWLILFFYKECHFYLLQLLSHVTLLTWSENGIVYVRLLIYDICQQLHKWNWKWRQQKKCFFLIEMIIGL